MFSVYIFKRALAWLYAMIDSSKLESSIEKHFTVLSLRIQSQIPRQPENFQFRFLAMHILGYPVVVSIEGSRTP